MIITAPERIVYAQPLRDIVWEEFELERTTALQILQKYRVITGTVKLQFRSEFQSIVPNGGLGSGAASLDISMDRQSQG